VMALDLLDLASVQSFVKAFKATGKQLNVVVCNAGVMICAYALSAQKHESQFATNHLGHFLLVTSLKDALLRGAEQSGQPSRVVMLSSSGHFYTYAGGVLPDDKIDVAAGYDRTMAYGQSKLANILFARELNARWPQDKVIATACHPGVILSTDLFRHAFAPDGIMSSVIQFLTRPLVKTIPQGVATTMFCALGPVVPGEYYSDVTIGASSAASQNRTLGERVWLLSEQWTAAFN